MDDKIEKSQSISRNRDRGIIKCLEINDMNYRAGFSKECFTDKVLKLEIVEGLQHCSLHLLILWAWDVYCVQSGTVDVYSVYCA